MTDLDDVQRRLKEIQSRKRGGMRWDVSKHTAEMALVALKTDGPAAGRRSAKARRRKRRKRLL